jgi:hypothetical protein
MRGREGVDDGGRGAEEGRSVIRVIKSTRRPPLSIPPLPAPPPFARRIRYPIRPLNGSLQYFARVTAVNRAGLNATAAGLPIGVDASA